jgi:glycosyltransferase involved in cell wall biosynthesis
VNLCFISPGHISVALLNGETDKFGGAEGQVAYLAAAFAKLGHQVELIYGDGTGKLTQRVIGGVKCIDAHPAWKRPGSLIAFWTALQKSHVHLIYARLPDDFLWLAGLFSKLHRESLFMYGLANDKECNPWQTYRYKRWFHNSLYALGLQSADAVAVQHQAQVQLVKPYTKGRIVLTPNLVRSVARQVRSYDATSIDAIWIAQIRPEKQLHLFLDVAGALPHLRFAVAGEFEASFDPQQRRDLEYRMRELANVSFLGVQRFEAVIQLLIRSKVLVNTSNWEGFPNTMLEAWSVGLPVVSLNIDPGGVIERENIGLISRSISKMVGDVERVAQTRSLNCEMGERGLAYVRRAHSFDAVCRAFEQVLPGLSVPGTMTLTEAGL